MASEPHADTSLENAPARDIQRVRAIAADLLDKADSEASIDRAAQLLKQASEADNQSAQAAKYKVEERKLEDDLLDSISRRRTEDRKTYISILTPLFTTVVLAATLGVQSYQFKEQRNDGAEAAQRQIQAAEDVRWNEAIKVLSSQKQLSPAGVLLASFSQSPRYRASAYDLAQQLLTNSTSQPAFSSIFDNVFEPVSWANLKWILDADRSLFAIATPLFEKSFVNDNKGNDFSKLTKAETEVYNQLYAELGLLAIKVAPTLKGRRPQNVELNLSATGFWDSDWKGANLSRADMTGVAWYRVDLAGADLSGITRFQGALLYETSWWNAAVISPELFVYLLRTNPYNVRNYYGEPRKPISQVTYEEALKRLKNASSIP